MDVRITELETMVTMATGLENDVVITAFDTYGNVRVLTTGPTDSQVETAVSDWLDDHPEATTTVTDGAVTDAKLAQSGGVLEKLDIVTGKPNLLQNVTWTSGTVNASGTIQSSTISRYTSLIPATKGVYFFTFYASLDHTTRIHQYNSEGTWVKQIVYFPGKAGTYTVQFNLGEDAQIRISTGIAGRIDPITLVKGENLESEVGNVAEEVNDINTGIGTLREDVQTMSMTQSRYIDAYGVIQTISNTGYRVSQYIDVTGYDTVKYSAAAGKNNLMCAFYDANKAFITGIFGTGALASNQTAEIPFGTKYVVVARNGNGGGTCTLAKWTYPIKGVIDNNFAERLQILTGTKSTAYINYTGVVTAATGAYRVLEATVAEGDKLKVNAWTENYNYLYAFYDAEDTLVGGYKNSSGSDVTLSNYVVTVPADAVKIAIAGNTSYSPAPSGYKVTGTYPKGVLKWAGKKWVCFGDSLTAVNTRTDLHYFDYVAESTGITVVNKGVSGTGYRNQADVSGAFYQKVSECPNDADVVTIFGGFNDGFTDLGTATDSGTTTVGGCINTTIDNLYAVLPTVQLGIVAPTPWVGANPYDHTDGNDYVELLEAICKRRSIPFLNLYYESNLRPWDSTFRTLAYSKDEGNGVHPDETGHKIISSRFEGFLDTLLNS